MVVTKPICHSVFAGKYLGLVYNPDYSSHRALFEVSRDSICNEHIYSMFRNWKSTIGEGEKSDKIKVWRGITGGFGEYILFIWAPPRCSLTAEYKEKEMYFTIIDIQSFKFRQQRPPFYYHEGYNIYVVTSKNPRYPLVRDYEALVGCPFWGTYLGLRNGAAVFKVLKDQPTMEARKLRIKFLHQMIQREKQENCSEFGYDKQNNVYILCPPECAGVETLQEFQMEIGSVTFYLDCKVEDHHENCSPNRVEVRINLHHSKHLRQQQ